MKLVLAGSHQQFLLWLAEGGRLVGDYRPVRTPADLWDIQARDVEEFHRVGEFADNPAWGSEEYRALMIEGGRIHAPWARPWDADWRAAQAD